MTLKNLENKAEGSALFAEKEIIRKEKDQMLLELSNEKEKVKKLLENKN